MCRRWWRRLRKRRGKDGSCTYDLHDLYRSCIMVCMRTTLNLDEELIEEARKLTGIHEKTALLHAGLQALVAREAAQRLAALGGSEPGLRPIPRRRLRPGK